MRTGIELPLPGIELAARKMPGHWLLARLGKRVLRPGGLDLTRCMLRSLAIRSSDLVVEFAPGLGVTTRLVLDLHPASYTAIEDNEAAAIRVRQLLAGKNQKCLVGTASDTGLPDSSAKVVYGEAMLTMQGMAQKSAIIREAARILKAGGRYGIHELCLVPEDLDETIKLEIQHALSQTIRVGARPLTAKEWRALLEREGFNVRTEMFRPMRLLKPGRLIQDEGFWGTLRFAWNLLRDAEARRRVIAMRRVFGKYRRHLSAIMLVGIKRPEGARNNAHTKEESAHHDSAPFEPASKLEMSWRRASFC
jgi:ubiquinone/menaquinone biosynthesis C-methylase UbiE